MSCYSIKLFIPMKFWQTSGKQLRRKNNINLFLPNFKVLKFFKSYDSSFISDNTSTMSFHEAC